MVEVLALGLVAHPGANQAWEVTSFSLRSILVPPFDVQSK